MRILGFSKKWDKLKQDEFTTFRFPRKDSDRGRDWHNEETLKIVFHTRQEHEYLGIAEVISKEKRWVSDIRNDEAIADGFPEGKDEMWRWLITAHKRCEARTSINKLTLRWIERV